MSYYILKPAVGTKETGQAYPAVESYDDYDFNAPNSVHKIKFNEFPDFTPNIRFKLAKGAKLCDMMGQATISAYGFLVSGKFKDELEKADLPPHRFYSASISYKGLIHQYYWVHFVCKNASKNIDFPRSNFFIRKFSSKLEDISLSSFDEYLINKEKIGPLKTIDFSKLVVNDIKHDLFFIPFRGEIFVNMKFKRLFDDTSLTGIEFEQATKINTNSGQ